MVLTEWLLPPSVNAIVALSVIARIAMPLVRGSGTTSR